MDHGQPGLAEARKQPRRDPSGCLRPHKLHGRAGRIVVLDVYDDKHVAHEALPLEVSVASSWASLPGFAAQANAQGGWASPARDRSTGASHAAELLLRKSQLAQWRERVLDIELQFQLFVKSR
jgi:hypothetical protein